MPDLERRTAYTCAQNMAWVREVPGSKGAIYRVVWKYQFEGVVQYAYECSCPAFKYRHSRNTDTCKHIEAVKHERCTWNAELDPGAQPNATTKRMFPGHYVGDIYTENLCPLCKGPVQAVEVTV